MGVRNGSLCVTNVAYMNSFQHSVHFLFSFVYRHLLDDNLLITIYRRYHLSAPYLIILNSRSLTAIHPSQSYHYPAPRPIITIPHDHSLPPFKHPTSYRHHVPRMVRRLVHLHLQMQLLDRRMQRHKSYKGHPPGRALLHNRSAARNGLRRWKGYARPCRSHISIPTLRSVLTMLRRRDGRRRGERRWWGIRHRGGCIVCDRITTRSEVFASVKIREKPLTLESYCMCNVTSFLTMKNCKLIAM
jgi:hypothetical protein